MKKAVLLILCSLGMSLIHAQIKLDSVITVGDSKFVYTYDGEGNTIETIEYQWNIVDNTWKRKFRTTCTESTNEMVTTQYTWITSADQWVEYVKDSCFNSPSGGECYVLSWNWITHSWRPTWKSTNQTDQNGNKVFVSNYRWINNAWTLTQISNRFQTSFDAEGRMLESIQATWDTSTLSWNNAFKGTLEYNTAGQRTDDANYNWSTDANDWQGTSRTSYTYENNKILSIIYYDWEESDNLWKAYVNRIHTYNAHGDLATIDSYQFDEELGEWVFGQPHGSYSYAYTPEGRVGEKIESYWYGPWNALVYSYRTNYAYDAAGNVIDYASYAWNFPLENWYNESREIKEFDLTANTTELIFPSSHPPSYSNWSETGKIIFLERYGLDPVFNDWQLNSTSFYYFSEFITATNEANAVEALKLFPNPVSNLLTPGANAPKTSSYQITDLNGRILQQEKTWNGDGIDVSRLIPGSYVIRLMEGNRVVTGKFVKL